MINLDITCIDVLHHIQHMHMVGISHPNFLDNCIGVLTDHARCSVLTRHIVADMAEVHWSRDLWTAATTATLLGGMLTALPVTFGQISKTEIN